MLRFFGNEKARNCSGVSRREFMRVGALGTGTLGLADLLRLRSEAAQYVRDRSVVVLFLQGGPTHIETFDPKMSAPVEYRAMFGETPTVLPGVTFGSHFPKLASLADRLSIVRSYRHGISSHGPASEHVAAGGNPTRATMGTIYGRVAGATSPASGIPNNVVLTPPAAGPQYKGLGAQTQRVTNIGNLPAAYRAFDPSAGSQILANMQLKLDEQRLDDRRALLGQLDLLRKTAEQEAVLDGLDRFQQQAFDVLLGGVSKAFDLSQEDPRTVARYDTGAYKIPPKLQKKKSNVPGQSPIALGKQMLMARRLVEAGCGFVTVTSAGWDMHGNAFGINDGMPLLGPSVDRAASAFIEDLVERGLYDKVLFVITGEFGRTPRINKKGGRDHWGNLCTLAFAGGGLRMGQVVGNSDRQASRPASAPISTAQLFGTVLGSLLDLGELRLDSSLPVELQQAITNSSPIHQLVS